MPEGVRKAAGDALKVGKHPVTALVPQPVQGGREKNTVIHAIFIRGLNNWNFDLDHGRSTVILY